MEEAADMLAARDAIETEQVAVGDPVRVGAEPQRRVRRAQADETAGEIEQGSGVVVLPINREIAVRGAERQPGIDARKTSMALARRPRQRRPRTVARQSERPVFERLGVLHHFERDFDLIEPEFLAIVEDDIAAQRAERSEERRVGKECVSKCKYRGG